MSDMPLKPGVDLRRLDGLLLGWQREALRREPAKERPPAYGWSTNEEDWEGGDALDREAARLEALEQRLADGCEAGDLYYTARCKRCTAWPSATPLGLASLLRARRTSMSGPSTCVSG